MAGALARLAEVLDMAAMRFAAVGGDQNVERLAEGTAQGDAEHALGGLVDIDQTAGRV